MFLSVLVAQPCRVQDLVEETSLRPIRNAVKHYDERINNLRDQYVKLVCHMVYIFERSSALKRIVGSLHNELLVLCRPQARDTFNEILMHCCALLDVTKSAVEVFQDGLGQLKVMAEEQRAYPPFTRCFDNHTAPRYNAFVCHVTGFRTKVNAIREALHNYTEEVVNAAISAYSILSADVIQVRALSQLAGLVVPLPSITSSQPVVVAQIEESSPTVDVAGSGRITWIPDASSIHSGLTHTESRLPPRIGEPVSFFASSTSLSADLNAELSEPTQIWVDAASLKGERVDVAVESADIATSEWALQCQSAYNSSRQSKVSRVQPVSQPSPSNPRQPPEGQPPKKREIFLFENYNRVSINKHVKQQTYMELDVKPVEATDELLDPVVTFAAAALHACCTDRSVKET